LIKIERIEFVIRDGIFESKKMRKERGRHSKECKNVWNWRERRVE